MGHTAVVARRAVAAAGDGCCSYSPVILDEL
jgi:hypothetical protein